MTEATVTLARPSAAARLAAIGFVAAGLLLAHHCGILETFAEPARAKAVLIELGTWGYVVFIAAYAALQPFGVPGTVFILVAPLIWPWPTAFALSMIGTMAASVIGFSFARFVARDWVARKIPARFQAYEEALARRGFVTVAALRFVFWMPQVLHFFLGVSRVGFWTHVWGSLVGYCVPLLLISYFGGRLLDAMRAAPLWVWLLLACVLLGVVTLTLRRKSVRASTFSARGAGDDPS